METAMYTHPEDDIEGEYKILDAAADLRPLVVFPGHGT